MGKALFSVSKTLGDPSALRPQGDKKRGLRVTKKEASGRHGGRVVLEGADATEGPLSEAKDLRGSVSDRRTSGEALRCPFATLRASAWGDKELKL